MEQMLAECLEDYHRRRALSEPATAQDYVEMLGSAFVDFLDVLAMEECLDRAVNLEPDQPLPHPFGEYTLVRELGRGTSGVVYEALHRPLGRKVAIKILRTGFDTEPIALRRFRQEAQACAQVRHDHIVEIYEVGEVNGRPYYAMPLLEGDSLARLIKEGQVPDARTLCRGLAGVADALATLHAAGIVHRDVKPGNILIEPGGRMILADFGLARTASSLAMTRTGQALGTPLYMSPEQLFGHQEQIDGRSDVYGLGVTLYEALCGKPPYKARSLHELVQLIVTARPRSLSDHERDVPRPCVRIAMKSIERQKEDRYETAAALRDDLLAYAEDRPVAGRPVSRARHIVRRYRRHLTMAAAVLIVATALMVWRGTRDGTIHVECVPSAEVVVNGQPKGRTPLDLTLPPGEYEIVLRRDGFDERMEILEVLAGKNRKIRTSIPARDGADPGVRQAVGSSLEIDVSDFPEPATDRGVGDGAVAVAAMLPRGDVRLADLRTYRVEVFDVTNVRAGWIEWRRADELLHRQRFVLGDEDPVDLVAEIPATVLEALRPGDRVTWGCVPDRGEANRAEFRLLDEETGGEIRDRLAAIDEALTDQPAPLPGYLRAHYLLQEGLLQGAIHEAERILAEGHDAHAAAIRMEALRRLDLADTRLWSDFLEAMGK